MSVGRLLSFGLAAVMAAGCSPSPAVETYEGEYFYNFENAVLTPTGRTDERWCIQGDLSKAELPATHPTGPWGTSYVVVRGTLGPLGKYGSLGSCKRVLVVSELVRFTNMRRGP